MRTSNMGSSYNLVSICSNHGMTVLKQEGPNHLASFLLACHYPKHQKRNPPRGGLGGVPFWHFSIGRASFGGSKPAGKLPMPCSLRWNVSKNKNAASRTEARIPKPCSFYCVLLRSGVQNSMHVSHCRKSPSIRVPKLIPHAVIHVWMFRDPTYSCLENVVLQVSSVYMYISGLLHMMNYHHPHTHTLALVAGPTRA